MICFLRRKGATRVKFPGFRKAIRGGGEAEVSRGDDCGGLGWNVAIVSSFLVWGF